MEDDSSMAMEPLMDFWGELCASMPLLRLYFVPVCTGVELSGKQRKVQWPVSEEDLEPDVTTRLELRQVSVSSLLSMPRSKGHFWCRLAWEPRLNLVNVM